MAKTGRGKKKKEKQYKEKALNKELKRRGEQQAGICKKQGQKVIER